MEEPTIANREPTGKPVPDASVRPWHTRPVQEVLEHLDVDLAVGLSDEEADRRRREHGSNRLQVVESRPWWRVLLAQLNSMVVYLLGAAAVLAFATGRWPEGLAVVAVIAVNTAIGFFSEWQAVRSMAALRHMGEQAARVRRDGRERELDAADIVPGDVVLLEPGELIPADLRLVEAERLRVNEAPLTGESLPVNKSPDAVDADTVLAERRDMLYKGTSVADGTGLGIAVGTGTGTELGRVLQLAQSAEALATPLQRRLDSLGRRLAWLTLGIAAVVAVVGLLVRHQDATLVVETALALGIAAIPEGLPIVSTIALARGMYLMAQRNALVNRLTAVETLGATRVIFTDKTGTLTENRMRLEVVATPQCTWNSGAEDTKPAEGLVRRALEIAVLCNSASLAGEGDGKGDPTEVALLVGGRDLGLERRQLLAARPQVRVEEFEPRVKKMATFHAGDDGIYVAVKGAPGAVLEGCSRIAGGNADAGPLDDAQRDTWRGRARELAGQGLRLLAVADKRVDSEEAEPYRDLCFVGLLGLRDPPRAGVKAAIDRCQAAGIRVEMVTGDQPQTAEAIAGAVGIIGDDEDPESVVMLGQALEDTDALDDDRRAEIYRANIFARVSPEQKLNLVRIYQERGEIVAMTGDGVNDAPALKQADIGVAMGRRGTEAAKQVADMVLRDDAFESIVAAVEQGRIIFGNIRKSVMFMLTTNVAEVLAVTVATLAGWTLPLLPLQILYLNVLTDVFPALALGVGPGSGQEMRRPPRPPREPVLTRSHWLEISGLAAVLAACVLGALLLAERSLGLEPAEAVTVSFLTIAFGKLWYTFALRDPGSGVFRNEVTLNPWIWGAMAVCALLLVAAVYLPGLNALLQTSDPGWSGWWLLLGMSILPFVAAQLLRQVQRGLRSGPAQS